MYDEASIGARLRALRRWRGMTLAQLAGQAGLSTSFLSMAERGQRALDRRSHIAALAAALQVSETELTGGPHLSRDRMQSDPHLCVPALRVALQTNTLGESLVDRARPLGDLVDAVGRIELLRRSDNYTAMGGELPDLLDELHYHVASPTDEAALRAALTALVDACHYASIIVKNLNYTDLAHCASQRGAEAAQILNDPVIIGKAAFPLVLNMPREGSWNRVLAVAERTVEALEPHAQGRESIEVLGMAVLNAALAAASVNDHARARTWLDEAHSLADRIPDEPTLAWQHFSATNVAIWDITVRIEGGESGGPVLQLAKQVQEAKLTALPFRKAGFLSDTGRGLARDPKTQRAALDWIRRAEAIAPQRIRNNVRVREAVAVMLEQTKTAAVGRELRGMASRMGVPH